MKMTNNNITMIIVVLRPQHNAYCDTTVFTTTVTSTLYRLRFDLKRDSFLLLN